MEEGLKRAGGRPCSCDTEGAKTYEKRLCSNALRTDRVGARHAGSRDLTQCGLAYVDAINPLH